MKKLLMMALVLGMATVASAGFQIIAPVEMDPSDTVMIQVVSDTPEIGGFAGGLGIVIGSGPGSWTGVSAAPGMPDPPAANNFADYYGNIQETIDPGLPAWDLWYMDLTSVSVDPFDPQIWFEAEFHCDGPGDVEIILTDFDLVPIGSVIIHQTPEPASLALLGLGGLFLRRRK